MHSTEVDRILYSIDVNITFLVKLVRGKVNCTTGTYASKLTFTAVLQLPTNLTLTASSVMHLKLAVHNFLKCVKSNELFNCIIN